MRHIPRMYALSVVLLSCCIMIVGCSDSPQQTMQDSGTLPANWQIRNEKPPSFTNNAVQGKWYLFNMYTINAITPANTEYLKLEFEGSYHLQLPKVDSAYPDASNFRAWVFIPDAMFAQNCGIGFHVIRPDGVRNRDFEQMNIRINAFTETRTDNIEYRYNSLPYELDPSAGELRKVIRTWVDVALPTKTFDVQLSFDPVLDEGALLTQVNYLWTPDSCESWSYADMESLSGSYTHTGDQYQFTIPHLHYLSAETERSIGNGAIFNAFITKPMYNQLDLEGNVYDIGTWNDSSIILEDTTMHGLSFLTLKYVLSNDEEFDESEQSITLNSLSSSAIPDGYEPYLPFDDTKMTDFQSFDPDGDGKAEFCYRTRNSMQYNAPESYVSRSSSPGFSAIQQYSNAASLMRKMNVNSTITYNSGSIVGIRIIQKTSSGKYLKMELMTQRAITLAEYQSLKNGIALANPID